MIFCLTVFVLLLFVEIIYFKIAYQFKISDKPNFRSSHKNITARGGGIIFPIAFIMGVFLYQTQSIYLASAVFFISIISFLDDVYTLNNKVRLSVHIISVLLILYQIRSYYSINITESELIFVLGTVFLLILIIGVINVCNFMDGINGMLGLYFIVNFGTLYYLQASTQIFIIHQNIWQILLLSIIVFGIFNFRKNAITFSGDVGSISLALIICYLLCIVIIQTQQFKWILILAVYGIDAVGTIFCRFIRNENIFLAHRSHFYQFLANHVKLPHVLVSSIYALVQLCINVLIIFTHNGVYALLAFLLFLSMYVLLRLKIEGKQALFQKYIY